MNAQRYSSDRRTRRGKLIQLEELRAHAVAQLKVGWTPEHIAGRLGFVGQPVRVGHETIYAYVNIAEGQAEQLTRETAIALCKTPQDPGFSAGSLHP